MTTPTDVVIIGAGIVGAACAAACAEAGLQVTVAARGICEGTTAAAMGHLVVMDDSPAQFALTQSGVSLWTDMVKDFPANVEYERRGTLWLATDDEQFALAQKRCVYYESKGVRAEMLDAERLQSMEPNLAKDLVGALRVPDDAVLYPPTATTFLLDKARARGAEFIRGDVKSVSADLVVLSDGRTLSARHVVVAAGCGSTAFGIDIGVRPRKGHLVITERYPGYINHQLIELAYLTSAHGHAEESVAFNVQPRPGGQLLIGSSRQFGSTDPRVEAHLMERMITLAKRYVPGITDLQAIRCWTGFRPSTADHLPVIGQASNGVWYATGHEGLGITTAPSTARLLVEQLLGKDPHIPIEPFAVERFATAQAGHG